MEECAFPFMELHHPEKGLLKIPYRQYTLNEKQQFVVLAIDFLDGFALGEHEGIRYDPMGKLEEQSFIFSSRIINSLQIDQWDFENYPNPEVVLITKL